MYHDVCVEKNIPGIRYAISFDLSSEVLKEFDQRKAEILLTIPTHDQELIVSVVECNIYSPDFSVACKSSNGKYIKTDYSKARHFIGTVSSSNAESSVSLNLRNGQISGVIRIAGKSYNIGWSPQLKRQILYEESDLKIERLLKCEQLFEESHEENITQGFRKSSVNCSEAVEVYFECDYDMFLNFSSDTTAVINYVTDLFAEIYLLYDSENLPILISEVVVWIGDDPYTDSSSGLFDFQDSLNQNGFNGHLAHLLTNDSGQNGGVAYIDELCDNAPYAYSDITNAHQAYPAYSWDVQVVAHELGHNFGSRHTHDCVWGPNANEQIDDCGNVHGGGSGSCYDPANPIIPSQGGTVMSYCHLDAVGIDFLNGFGPEPGTLMREKHSDCFCDNATCQSAQELVLSGTYGGHPDHGNGATSIHATHADWFYYEPLESGTLSIESCGEMVDTRLWIWSGTCEQLNFVAVSDDDCDMGNGADYASQIVSIPVSAGLRYYIEWDDRWSNQAFDFYLDFIPNTSSNPCDGMNLDLQGIVYDTTLHAKNIIQSNATLMSGSFISLKAGEAIQLNAGFEVQTGSILELGNEDCEF